MFLEDRIEPVARLLPLRKTRKGWLLGRYFIGAASEAGDAVRSAVHLPTIYDMFRDHLMNTLPRPAWYLADLYCKKHHIGRGVFYVTFAVVSHVWEEVYMVGPNYEALPIVTGYSVTWAEVVRMLEYW